MTIKGLVFDVGGVLRDSSKSLNYSYKKAFEKRGLEFPFSVPETWRLQGFDEFNDFYQINKALVAALRAKTNISELLKKEDSVKEMLKIIEENTSQKDEEMFKEIEKQSYKYFATDKSKSMITVFDGVIEGIKLLHSKGFPLGVVSVAKRELNIIWLKEHISDHFDPVMGIDEYNNKADGIRKCCEAFCLDPQNVAMVGDSTTDLLNGKKAGCKTIAVLCGMGTKQTLEKENPDYIVNDVLEMAKMLTNLK